MTDDPDLRVRSPRCERVGVARAERDLVEAALGIDERGLDAWQVDGDVAVAGVGVARHGPGMQVPLAEVARDVIVAVHAREAEPRAVALVSEGTGLDVDVDLRDREQIATRHRVTIQQSETELTDRTDDRERGRTRGEVDDQRSGRRTFGDLHALLRRFRRRIRRDRHRCA